AWWGLGNHEGGGRLGSVVAGLHPTGDTHGDGWRETGSSSPHHARRRARSGRRPPRTELSREADFSTSVDARTAFQDPLANATRGAFQNLHLRGDWHGVRWWSGYGYAEEVWEEVWEEVREGAGVEGGGAAGASGAGDGVGAERSGAGG